MEVNSQNINTISVQETQNITPAKNQQTNSDFASELKQVQKEEKKDSAVTEINNTLRENNTEKNNNIKNNENKNLCLSSENNIHVNNAIDGLENTVNELFKVNQKEELSNKIIKNNVNNTNTNTEKNEDNILIDNNINMQEQTELLNAQTGTNMNFNSNGQPFSQFINSKKDNELSASASDLAEEKAILSTMEENIAIARKNMMLQNDSKTAIIKNKESVKKDDSKTTIIQNENDIKKDDLKTITVQNEEGIKKVDSKTNILVDTVVKYDTVIMDKNDVNFFTNLVENGSVNLNEVQNTEKSSQVSKALADLLVKAMNENKPVRIDFDNNISVIIRIDRAGKISADFLPSSQIAETYLKENLPLLKQRFDDNNIDYNELNQRKQKQDTQDNRKKGRKDE